MAFEHLTRTGSIIPALVGGHLPKYRHSLRHRLWYQYAGAEHKNGDIADGAIVGSAIIKLLEQHGQDAPQYIGACVRTMKDALR